VYGLPIKIQVPCGDEFHDVVVSERGRISFPAHPGNIKGVERLIHFEELGGKIKGGCHRVWLAWLNATNSLPEKLARFRLEHDRDVLAARAAEKMKKAAGTRFVPLNLDAMMQPKERPAFKGWVLRQIGKVVRSRGHRCDVRNAYVDEDTIGDVLVVFARPDLQVSAGWYPPGSLSLTVTVDGCHVNVVRDKNVEKAIGWAADLVDRAIVRQQFKIAAAKENPQADELRERLLKLAATITFDHGHDMMFFRAVPTTSMDGLCVQGTVPGPLTPAAVKVAMGWLTKLSDRLERLRQLSHARQQQEKKAKVENKRRKSRETR
jgi:hypothetical protein